MEEVVTSVSHIGLTLLGLAMGWIVIMWLDKNVFNKDRYKRRNDDD